MPVSFEAGHAKRASTSSCLVESPEGNDVDEALGPLLVAAADSWKMSADSPFFDPRLIVDTCAQFVSSSFQARTSGGEIGSRRAMGQTHGQSGSGAGKSSNVPMLQAMTSHAHEYAGADRLVTELVPRCREYREELRQTVRPLCAEMRGPDNLGGSTNELIMDYEVDRFLRARLVQCDLSELLTYDCFVDVQDDDGALARHSAVTKIPNITEVDTDNRDFKPSYDAELELSIERFELRFWRSFAHGLGISLFGSKRPDLVERLEASAQDVFDRYEGELQLAMNSLMGWLPSWLSESLFIAFVGLGASVAIRQRSAKYTMLHRCVKSLLQSSGRYVFISTPGWYLPLVNWLPGLGRKEMLRMPSVMLSLSLRTVWPSPCLDPDRCVAAVDELWGGPQGDRKAHLKLADGVESMGSWILRMTFGCERLFSHALQVVREYARVYEDVFDETIEKCDLPFNHTEARKLTQDWAEKIHTLGNLRRRKSTRLLKRAPTLQATNSGYVGAMKRGSRSSTRFNYDFATRKTSAQKAIPKTPGGSSVAQLNDISRMNYLSRVPHFASWERQGGDNDGNHQPSLLAQLHADSHGPTTSSEPRLRSVIATGEGDNIVWWPLGQSDTFRERIPIHRTPDLAPNAAPPILEDGPSDFMLPEAAMNEDYSPFTAAGTTPSTVGNRSPARSPRKAYPTTPSSQGVAKSKSKKKIKCTSKEAFDPERWQLQWFGLGRVHAGGPTTSQSAPQLTMPEDFQETLDRMWQSRRSEAAPNSRITRAVSAPPAFDTSDFNVGDPAKNTAIAYALQMQIRTSLSTACSEGPLRLAWRKPTSPLEATVLLRTRLNLGVMFLMAAMRAPLPSWEQLPLSYFVVLNDEVSKQGARLEPPKVRLPDGVYAMGCSPLFHSLATEDSARVPPLMAQAFHVGVPHAFLEDGPMRDALVDRRVQKRWSEGSLLILFTSGAFIESHLAQRAWIAERGWLQQDYASFFPLACCFRLILGLEFLGLLHRSSQSGPESIVRLEVFLQFLEGSDSAIKDVKVKLDMSAEDGAKPLLIAPWLLPHKAADADIDPSAIVDWDRACYPGNEAIALEDFAVWVSSLKPGRMIYSSHRSPTGDLYLKLDKALIVFAFVNSVAAKGPLSGQMVFDMYEDAIGDPTWWNVDMISYIVMTDRIAMPLEVVMGSAPSLVVAAGEVVEGADESCQVLNKTEIVVCNPKMLNAFLGPIRSPVFAQTQLFTREIGEQEEETKLLRQLWMQRHQEEARGDHTEETQQDHLKSRHSRASEKRSSRCSGQSAEMEQSASAESNADTDEESMSIGTEPSSPKLCSQRMSVMERLQLRHSKGIKHSRKSIKRGDDALVVAKHIIHRNRKLAQGSAINAVEWRAKRAGKPKAPQIGQNLDVLRGLLTHIEEHMHKFLESMPDLWSLSASEASPPSSPNRASPVAFMLDSSSSPRPNSQPTSEDGRRSSQRVNACDLHDISRQTSPRQTSPDDTGDQCTDQMEAKEAAERGRSNEPKNMSLSIQVDSDSDFGEEREVRIERLPSPVRTDKSRKWRPPTPYPRMDWAALRALDEMELAGREVRGIPKKPKQGRKPGSRRDGRLAESSVKVDDTLIFDFIGFGSWKSALRDSSKFQKRHTRSSNSEIPGLRHG